MIPEHIKKDIDRHVKEGTNVGEFVYAVLCNNLKQAIFTGTFSARANLFDIVFYLHEHCPPECWGSSDKVRIWIEQKESKPKMPESEEPKWNRKMTVKKVWLL